MSVRPSALNKSDPSGRSFMKFDIRVFFESLSRTFNFDQNLTRITGTLHADQYTFLIISCSILLRISNVSYKSCTENQNTHFIFSIFFFFFFAENRAGYERLLKNIVEPDRPQMTIWPMRISHWVPKVTNTHSRNT
jgi:hypothetical protein